MPLPAIDVHRRPSRPRPAVCRSANTNEPAGAPASPNTWATSNVDVTLSYTSTRGKSSNARSSSAPQPS